MIASLNKFYLLFFTLVFLGCLFFSSPLMAQGGGGADSGGSSGCDWTDLKASIEETESSGLGCDTRGPYNEGWGYAHGKYQFIEATWNSMSASCPNAGGCQHGSDAFFNSPVCCEVQECAMDNLLQANLQVINDSAACQNLLGTTINSPRYGSCTVTTSGLLAAGHLGGSGNLCTRVAGGGVADNLGTTLNDYVCRHGGIPVPSECTPVNNPGGGIVIGTLPQIIISGRPPGPIDPLRNWWVFALQQMAEQFTATMIWQVEAVGMLLDAKHQLETQRLFQQKTAEAHRDYQPSEQMCTFGTFTQDLAATQRSADVTKQTINQELLQRELGTGDTMGETDSSDFLSRVKRFRDNFCNPADNGNGLRGICPTPAPAHRQNADINYTMSIDQKLSLDMDMTDSIATHDEEAVFALIDNLFAHSSMPRINPELMLKEKFRYHYMNYRSLVAMRGIARNSIANIIAMKTETPFETTGGSAPYMKSLMTEFGLDDVEIVTLLGENPSYYAQMEMLTKKMYQNPSFYTNLIDKPANIKRMRAAMRAIKLMQDRDITTALHRREMLLSMMLELRLRERADAVYNATERSLFEQN